jgi:F-type H+-transporting ATPase subunit delta
VREGTVTRNYAETLFALAEKHEGVESFGNGIESVAKLVDENPDFRLFLATPRIAAGEKKDVLRKVFGAEIPPMLLNFLLITVDKRRQGLLREIAREYDALVDGHLGRMHVEVSVAREIDEETIEALSAKLSTLLGKRAVPHVRVKPELLGGVLIRAGDTIYDGSLRRRLYDMRRRMMAAELPGEQA